MIKELGCTPGVDEDGGAINANPATAVARDDA